MWLRLDEMLAATTPEVLLVCPSIEAHAEAVDAGLAAGCHVLVEKPLAADLGDAVRLAARASEEGLQLGVVQNWRTKSVGTAARRAVGEGMIGDPAQVFFRYLRDREKPHLPDYLYEEPDPILHAMAIHHVDLVRFVLGQEIASVAGQAARPSWSRYRHPSTIQLWMETEEGVSISYVATFSSRAAHIPMESLQVEGDLGTLSNESDYSEPPLLLCRRGDESPVDLTEGVVVRDRQGQYELADRAILDNFHDAVVGDAELIAPAADNINALAVLAAASRALSEGRTVRPAEELERVGAAVA